MASNTGPPSLAGLYSDLNRLGQNQDYERALKLANRILQEHPGELSAFHCKIVCLINLEKFNDALVSVNKDKTRHSALRFEKAYCEYRLNRTTEALATLRAAEQLDNRCKELLGQVLYRLEEYSECYELYKELVKNSEDDFEEERETNLAAVLASLQMWEKAEVEDPGLRESTYELCYNHACYFIGKGDFVQAEKKLRQAEALCKESFADDPDMTEEDIDEEMAIIRVQLAYLAQQAKKNGEAMSIYNKVQKVRPSDVGLMAVLSNNVVAINKDQNVFDSKKKMKLATGTNLKHKLSASQKHEIEINQCLLQMHSNQTEQCHQTAQLLRSQDPGDTVPVLIEAAQFVRDKETGKAVDLLEEFGKSNPSQSKTVWLTVAQLHLSTGSFSEACDALKQLGDLQYKPGVVSTLVTLYMHQDNVNAAIDVLSNALNWYKKNDPKSSALETLLRVNTNLQLKHGSPDQAVHLLEELRKNNPKDPRVLAQLISAYSKVDPAKAEKISRELPSVEEIARSVDVEALETSFSSLGPKYIRKVQKGEASPASGAGDASSLIQKKKKKKKKTKLPKHVDTNAILDPERWLPRRERSYYKGKKKDKRRGGGDTAISRGPQGATSGNMDYLDASKSPPSGSSGNTSSPRGGSGAASQGVQGPRQQKPTQAQKKKKKGKR